MITLYRFGPNFGLVDPSPFCIKVELYLRAAGLEYQSECGIEYLRKAPKKKLPYIEDNGNVVADSALILDYLKTTCGDSLDSDLNDEQKAVAHAFIKMMDENLYWCVVYDRWLGEESWPKVRTAFFGGLPFPLRHIVPVVAQKGVRKSLYAHGLGRHDHDEIMHIAMKDLTALSNLLGDKEWFLIDKPTTLDVTAYAFLCGLFTPELPSDLGRRAAALTNLRAFVERVDKQYYGN
ncbi:MAG: glutathione S-transferase family protein [Gammaproteobacteria bacterium]